MGNSGFFPINRSNTNFGVHGDLNQLDSQAKTLQKEPCPFVNHKVHKVSRWNNGDLVGPHLLPAAQ